ncbi:Cullin-1 [Gracilariopsis chorda]|uniref:Cullin-1 n=1 Tax=Gracilariopsis chorda TaxID=448386 RepID=A0A2V3IRG5_9FLOR|nr:Cullin-1 [Gracilariopsis chorda]|eukprot:PXF44708.1 Cullin-1 [Gracilariopsis chorda]
MEDLGIDFDTGWSIIESRGFEPLAAVLDADGDYRRRHGTDGPKEWNHIYTTVYKMCIQKTPRSYAKDLYQRVQSTLKAYLRSSCLPAIQRTTGEESLLRELRRRWSNHKLMVKWVTRTFSYIDRYYVKRNEEPSLEHAGYMCFRKEVFDSIVASVRKAALNIVQRERDGDNVDRSLLRGVLDIFVEMGMGKLDVYTSEWEAPFLEETADFYRRTSAKWAEEDSFPDFMRKADCNIIEELERAAQYLNGQTQERLLRVYEEEVLIVHQKKMLSKDNSGLVALLENNKKDDLLRLYRLYSRVPQGLIPVGQILKNHIQKEGMELVREQRSFIENTKSEASQKGMRDDGPTPVTPRSASSSSADKPEYIQRLISLHDRYTELVTNCFGRHAVFTKAMKEAFERFVNEQVGDSSTAQLFANYCDSLLNSGGRGAKMAESDVETQLEKLVKLFTYLTEKDVFQEFCRKQLAKRLLLDRSHSDDAERHLISKLKQSCGAHFTSKLEGMITDINVSRDTQTQFREWYNTRHRESVGFPGNAMGTTSSTAVAVGSVEFSVRVLTTGHWPTYSEDSVVIPSALELCERRFKEFYDMRTSQRVLRWVHSLGKGALETSLFTGKRAYQRIELHVSTHQLCILVLFNLHDHVTYAQMLETLHQKSRKTGTPSRDGEDLLKASLVSLMSRKTPLLVKEPRNREFSATDMFTLNTQFVSPKRRLNVPMPMARINEQEKEAAHDTVVEDRRHAIEAAIVRVMKQHKTLDHQRLIMEVSKLCNPVFKPEPRAIKNRIEELISREYLARDDSSNSSYRYLA